MTKLLDKMNPQSRLSSVIRETADRTAERILEGIQNEKQRVPSANGTQNEIQHLIDTLDTLRQFRSWIEQREGGSKRNRRRFRPHLQQIDLLSRLQMERLNQLGVSSIETDHEVDIQKHAIRTTVGTTDPNQHGRIVEVWREGYIDGSGVVIRQATVVVRRFSSLTTNKKEPIS